MNITPEDIKQARRKLGMSRVDFGWALGMKGNSNTVHKAILQLEIGKKEIWPKLETALEKLIADTGNEGAQ